MSFPSKYNSFCIKCHKSIRVGEFIVKDSESEKWVHENCPNGFVSSTKMEKMNLGKLIAIAEENSVQDGESVSVPPKDFIPSFYQNEIGKFIEDPVKFCKSRNEPVKTNLLVNACPGSGKTTTIVWALKFTKPTDRVAFLAFGKDIASELKRRQNLGMVPEHVHISTVHSLGLSYIMKLENKPEVDPDKVSMIMDDFWPISKKSGVDPITRRKNRQLRYTMRDMVSFSKSTLIDYNDQNAVLQMCERYGIEIDEDSYEAVYRLPDVMKSCMENLEVVDFDDMPWLPLVSDKINIEKFDIVFVDERQDLTPVQIEFILKSLQPETGRIVAVGDPRQSIFAFTGADTKVVAEMGTRLDAKELPLSISYRCPKAVVNAAKQVWPEIELFEDAEEGEEKTIKFSEFMNSVKVGDMVLCRTNAPLVKPAYAMIRRGIKVIIRGRKIGEDLIHFVEKFNADDLNHLESLMAEWTEKTHSALIEKGKELAAEAVLDKHETVLEVAQQCRTVMELVEKLRMMFSDKVEGIVFSSVHRSKGLEANNVYILHGELMPHPKAKEGEELEQEMNCKFVAITRAKKRLVWVLEE